MNGKIYKIVNKINSKAYIGQTVTSLKHRFNSHFSKFSHCVALKEAIHKYGRGNFEILCLKSIVCDSRDELNNSLNYWEKQFILSENTLSPNGYNLTEGGDCSSITKESVAKRAKKNKKSIICNETGKVYESSRDAAKELGVNRRSIERVLRGQRRHYLGFTYSYINGVGKPISNDVKLWQIAKKPKLSLPVKCNENGQIYKNMTEAAKALDVHVSKICLVLQGKRKSTKGLTFSYLSQS